MSLNHASAKGPAGSSVNHPLWTLLGPSKDTNTLATMNLNSAASLPPISTRDKTSTSLRLLLCDTQRTMEGFSSQITTLTRDLGEAKRRIEEAGKIVEDGHMKAAEDVRLLLTRMQVSMTKSLDQVNTSLSSLVAKSDTQQAAFLSKQDNLQIQIITLVQQLGIEQDSRRQQDIEQRRRNEKYELDFGALMETLANQQTVISGQATSISSLTECVSSLKEDISNLSKTVATPAMTAGSMLSLPGPRPQASTMVDSDLLESPSTNVPETIYQGEQIIRGIHNPSMVSKPPSNGSVAQGIFLSRLTHLQRKTFPNQPDQRDFEVKFPSSQIPPQQYRSLSRSSAYSIHSSPNHNFKSPRLSSPLAVPSSPLNALSGQNHATGRVLSVTSRSLKRPFGSLGSATGYAASSADSAFFTKRNTNSSTPSLVLSSSVSRPWSFIPSRVTSRKSDGNSADATLEPEIQPIEHTRKKIKGNSRTILQDESPRGGSNLETRTKDLWVT